MTVLLSKNQKHLVFPHMYLSYGIWNMKNKQILLELNCGIEFDLNLTAASA